MQLRKIFLFLFVFLVAFMVYGWFNFWRSPAYYTDYARQEFAEPIWSMEQYGEVADTHPRPYVVDIETSKGGLLLFGSEHTKDPAHPQFEDIKSHWDAFNPSVALVEGRLGFLIPGLMNPVEQYGEMGFVNALARGDKVEVYSWEPPREVAVQVMLSHYPAEQVALFYVLGPYFSNYRYGKPENPEAVVEDYIASRISYPGLEKILNTIEDIDRIWQRDFADTLNWRDISDEFGVPGYLGDMGSRSNENSRYTPGQCYCGPGE